MSSHVFITLDNLAFELVLIVGLNTNAELPCIFGQVRAVVVGITLTEDQSSVGGRRPI